MITTLHIKNIGIIEDLSIDLNQGFNILTGETGAGKTLIIDSLGIISGGRFSKEMIRQGEDYSFVELNVYLPNHEKAIDGNIIISREINLNGKNQCKINGRLVTVNELKTFMTELIDIHGQGDNQKILDTKSHIEYLDNFVGEEIEPFKSEYYELYEKYCNIKKELKENYGDDKEKQRKLDLLKYQLNEIESAKLKKNEEEELQARRNMMLNSEKISENLSQADEAVGENSIDMINTAIKSLEKISSIDSKYDTLVQGLKNVYYDLQELSRDISSYREDIYFDEDEREEVEERLNLIYTLKRKYGNNIEEILNYKEQFKQEIDYIENLEENINKLKEEKKKIEKQMLDLAKNISTIRTKYAKELNEKINKELADLEMKNSKINVKVEFKEENNFKEDGMDDVQILICTNVGEEEKPLTKIASGGEMSRIMLAIKTVLADTDEVPILIFDEIDTGISGKAANAVADKISKIAKHHQVICVSHLASLAAMADHNYYISKSVQGMRTATHVEKLSEDKVLKEIARIASGEINDITLKHAEELRKKKI